MGHGFRLYQVLGCRFEGAVLRHHGSSAAAVLPWLQRFGLNLPTFEALAGKLRSQLGEAWSSTQKPLCSSR